MTDEALPEADAPEGAPHPRHAPRVMGQDAAVQSFLSSYIADKLHHAWLITGPQGIGKATFAWQIAQTLLHYGSPAKERIDQLGAPTDSAVTRQIHALSHPGIFLIRRKYDEKLGRHAQNIVVDDVRGLRNFFGLSSADGTHRVVIIDSVDEMNVSAANALLKLLEEPPKNATLLLISHQPSGLLPTIKSRCRTLALRQLTAQHLGDIFTACDIEPPEDLYALCDLAAGSAGEAMRLVYRDGLSIYRQIESFFDAAPMVNRTEAHSIANALAGKGAETQRELFCDMLWRWALTIAKEGAIAAQMGTQDRTTSARFIPTPEAAPVFAHDAQEILSRLRTGLQVNLDPASLILDTLLSLAALAKR